MKDHSFSVASLLFAASVLFLGLVPKLLLFLGGNGADGMISLTENNKLLVSGQTPDDEEDNGRCQLLETLVPIPDGDNPSFFTHPKCVKVKKCQGCCSSAQISCQPKSTKLLRIPILRYKYVKDRQKIVRNDTFSVEEHRSCECNCIVKPQDCSDEQEHDIRICECICKDGEEFKRCTEDYKIWDKRSCQCICRNVKKCHRGYKFDSAVCRCKYDKSQAF